LIDATLKLMRHGDIATLEAESVARPAPDFPVPRINLDGFCAKPPKNSLQGRPWSIRIRVKDGRIGDDAGAAPRSLAIIEEADARIRFPALRHPSAQLPQYLCSMNRPRRRRAKAKLRHDAPLDAASLVIAGRCPPVALGNTRGETTLIAKLFRVRTRGVLNR